MSLYRPSNVSAGKVAPGLRSRLWYFTRVLLAPRRFTNMFRFKSSHRSGALAGLGLWAVIVLLALPIPVSLANDEIYDATVPLEGWSEQDRQASFADALGIVAVRVSGQSGAAGNDVVQSANAAKYVQRYSRTGDRLLRVGFDPASVNRLLRAAGLPIWPAERPRTLVLLSAPSAAIGEQAMRNGDASTVREELEQAAELRGIPLVWPRSGVEVAAVRGRLLSGDRVELDALLANSGAQGVLAGMGSDGRIDWIFADAGGTRRATGPAATGANLAADAYADVYAPRSTRVLSSISITVAGVEDLYGYAALMDYLESLSLVQSVQVQGMDRDVARLMVTLQGDADLLRRIARLDTHLLPGESLPDGTAPTTDYLFRP